jgi:hypothetical protein
MTATAEDFVNDPANDYAMSDLFACDNCHRPHLLFASFGGRLICGDCWQAKGSPWPRRPATAEEIHAAELRTRERMQARGGTDRHMVRNGKT